MPIDVELQKMHSYSFLMLLVVAVFVAASVIGLLVFLIKRILKRKNEIQPVKEMTPATRESIKSKYNRQLDELEKKCQNKKISNRKAYQELSKLIRHFVYEATGIKVHSYTLEEIKETNLSSLYSMILECYAPEFSVDHQGEIYGSIEKARQVIKTWN